MSVTENKAGWLVKEGDKIKASVGETKEQKHLQVDNVENVDIKMIKC